MCFNALESYESYMVLKGTGTRSQREEKPMDVTNVLLGSPHKSICQSQSYGGKDVKLNRYIEKFRVLDK